MKSALYVFSALTEFPALFAKHDTRPGKYKTLQQIFEMSAVCKKNSKFVLLCKSFVLCDSDGLMVAVLDDLV